MNRLALCFAILTAGCATQPEYFWVRPDSTPQEFSMDQGQCRAQGFAVPGASLLQAVLVFDGCMQGKGWTKQAR